MKVLIIDNYDSFTYNLYQFIGEILTTEKNRGELPHFEIMVKRNNQIDFKAIEAMAPDRIIISPGPGSPDDPRYFGVCAEVIEKLGKTTPLLGVSVFNGVPDQLEVMRYHSLIADAATLPECLEVTATVGALTADNFAERGRWQAAGEFVS